MKFALSLKCEIVKVRTRRRIEGVGLYSKFCRLACE